MNKKIKFSRSDIEDELGKHIKSLTDVAKKVVSDSNLPDDEIEYTSEEERAKLNEKLIQAPFHDDDNEVSFMVTEEEMEHLSKVQKNIIDLITEDPTIYSSEDVVNYCREVGYDKFNIFEYIGYNKERLKKCLKINPN